jgi:hypothetical protein
MTLDTHSVVRGCAPHPASVIAACGEKTTFGLRRLVFAFVLLLQAAPAAWAQVPPTVVNPTSTNVTITSAVLGGEVSSDGGVPILERGVVFAVTATNADPVFGAVGATRVKADATTGVFTVQVAGLPAATDYSFKAYAINSAGTTWSGVGTFSTPAAGTGGTRSSLTGAAVTNVTSDSATISATAGLASGRFRGAVYSEEAVNAVPAPVGTGVTQWVDAVTGSGFFQMTATGLKRNTRYVARVFISYPNGNGSLSIVSAGDFTTLGAPIVTTPTSADVTGTGATLGGTVASDGGFTERGVVYALTSANSNPEIGGAGVVQVAVAGTDLGAFTAPVTGLTPGVSYSFKAYAINADGTGYSEVGTFGGMVPAGPEIALSGNGQPIDDGATGTSATNHTDFGGTAVAGGTVVRTFTIANSGTTALNLTGTPKVVVSGTHAADFTITLDPATPVSASGGTTTLQITFNPSANGLRTATLTLASDDSDENPFDFAIAGTGLSAFEVWAASHSVSSNPATPGANNLANLLNFAFGMSPLVHGSGPLDYSGNVITPGTVVCVLDGGMPQARFVRRTDHGAAGLSYITKFSADQVIWQTDTSTPTVLADDGTHQVVGMSYPLLSGGAQARFFIIEVNLAP